MPKEIHLKFIKLDPILLCRKISCAKGVEQCIRGVIYLDRSLIRGGQYLQVNATDGIKVGELPKFIPEFCTKLSAYA